MLETVKGYVQETLHDKSAMAHWLLAIFLVAIIWLYGINTPAYAVIVDGNKEFVVENSADVTSALNQMHDETYGPRVDLKHTFVKRAQLVAPESVAQELKLAFQPKVIAATIWVNGKQIAYLPDRAVAEAMLEQLKNNNSAVASGETLVSVGFEEDVQVTEGKVPAAKVMSWNDAWNVINLGTDTPQVYKVQPGDSLWTIARKNDMYVSDIVKSNQIQEDAILALGQALYLNKPTPLVTVVAQVQGQGNEVIPYQTITQTDNSVNGIKVKTEGQNGERFVAYTAVKRNGEVENREITEEKLIKEAVDKVVLKNSRATYQVASRGGASSGRLIWPVTGYISQSYGGGHTGLDIAGSKGSTIVAADGGTVTSAGWEGGYGYFVIINHGNGLVTRYAHCSTMLVRSGQVVDQGQAIATRGSTGRSTGPHLHFEVMQNGSFRSPLSYLR